MAHVRRIAAIALLIAAVLALPAQAQTPTGTLLITVLDPSGAVIVEATVAIAGIEPATKSVMPAPVKTTAQGVARIPDLMPGRYTVKAEFPGFQTRVLPDV